MARQWSATTNAVRIAGRLLVVGVLCLSGCDEAAPAPDVSTTSPQPAPDVKTAPLAVPSTPEAAAPGEAMPEPSSAAASPPVLEAPQLEPAEDAAKPSSTSTEANAAIPDSLGGHILALQKLGAEVEYGVGDRIISVDLDARPVTDADLEHVAALEDLRSLNLAETAITDEGLAKLTSLKKLKFLYLFNTAVSDVGVKHLQEMPRLEVLCLDQTQITDAALVLLEDLPRLEKLHVHSKRPITDKGLESLKKHTRLFELRVGGPGITEAGLESLKEVLPSTCTVDFDPAQEVDE